MQYRSNPEVIFLKWAYKNELIDDDDLYEFSMRYKREAPEFSRLEALVEWEMLTTEQIADLLRPEAIDAGEASGLIDGANASSLRELC